MKTHAIVQGFVICLLLVWTSVWDVLPTDAGGPPIRLAVDRGNTPAEDEFLDALPPVPAHRQVYTQLIPTEISENKTQLIPTEIDSEAVVTTIMDPAIAETGVLLTGELGKNIFRLLTFEDQKFYVFGVIPEPADMKSFLDIHVSRGPFRYVETEFSPKSSKIAAPWIVDDQPWELVPGLDIPETSMAFRMNCERFYELTGGKPWWMESDPPRSPFESCRTVLVAKPGPGRFNTVELAFIRHLICR